MTVSAQVSIIIGSYNSARTIERCLKSLEIQVQQAKTAVEVILVDSSEDGTAQIVRAGFPWVKLMVQGERCYPGDARNIGIARANGSVLVFIDSDCVAGENWLDEIVTAHQSELPVVGGSVDNANPESYVGWGYYFSEFMRWAPQVKAGLLSEIPTCCLSIKRWAFDQYGPFLEGRYCSDTDFNWKLDRAGKMPFFNPKIKVGHINPGNLKKFLLHEVEHGRAFGELRVTTEQFSRSRQWLYVLGAPLLPWILWGRIAERVIRNKTYIGQFLLAAPVVFLGQAAWSWGEARAYFASLFEQVAIQSLPVSGED